MSDQSRAAAHDGFRTLPTRPSLRHLKLEAKQRLAAGEFTTLHDAQLAIAREHGLSSWAMLKQRIAAVEAEGGDALRQLRWVFGRFANAGEPEWTAPSRTELSEHFTDRYLSIVPPESWTKALGRVAVKLREELVVLDSGPRHLRAKIAGLRVEAAVEEQAPHRLLLLRLEPDGRAVTDTRVAQPPTASIGQVPEPVLDIIEDAYTDLGLVGLAAVGDDGYESDRRLWAYCHGWADLERDVPLRPEQRFPARSVTMLVTSTAVLRLIAEGVAGLDDPVNRHLRLLRLADDAVTIRDLLAHTGGVDSPPSVWADTVVGVSSLLGPIVGCSGRRGEFAYSTGGYGVLGQLIADATGTSFAQAVTSLVLEPLGMADSDFPTENPAAPESARGYRLADDGSFEPEPLPMYTVQAAGGLWSTGGDLVRFGSGWHRLLPPDLAEQALHPQSTQDDAAAQVGLGWLLQPAMDAVGHTGMGPGWSTSLITRPSTGHTCVVVTNRLVRIEAVNARLIGPPH